MNTKSAVIAAATVAIMIIAAPANVMAQAAPGGNPGGGTADNGGEAGGSADAGTYGFGSPYHNIEVREHGCDNLRKRAQWSDSYYWWREYNRCVAQ